MYMHIYISNFADNRDVIFSSFQRISSFLVEIPENKTYHIWSNMP